MSHDALVEALSGTIETLDDGSTIYRNNAGEPHRVGGPALFHPTGTKTWCRNGRLHRTDGPAIVYADGGCRWFIDGVEMTEERVKLHISAGDYCGP